MFKESVHIEFIHFVTTRIECVHVGIVYVTTGREYILQCYVAQFKIKM